ncbi:MAG TPA: asparagine synthase (glutamine-hydrolyzing) [Candidatus Dormibacteraeota bacterium]|nr:asparagine synthase (glutamine-hydrolyzing) [Candidatus Dormibacteraeota bacterium]
MCGIVAVVGGAGIDVEVVDRMRDRMAHRGPDGAHTWTDDDGLVALGHRRLSIIDLSDAADQPMFSADGSLVLNFNGEIYNYIELRDELRALGHRFRTQSDTEVLLVAYEEWGAESLSRLNGMFAFTLWDARKRHLFVARDRFGEKPMFYCRLPGGGMAFASEIKALFAHPDVMASVDEATLRLYVNGRYFESDEATLFRGIHRLPAGHAMTVDQRGQVMRTWRYWTLDFTAVDDGYREDRAVEQFQELLRRSVAMRLRSDVPVGTSLSGGLDSSTVVALVAGVKDERGIVTQNTFSARFDNDPTLSEGRFADLVAAATGVHTYMTTPAAAALIDESRALHYHQEEPFLSASIYLQWCVARLAQAHGTTVILDGQGSDELLGGYQYYFQAHQLDLIETGRYSSALGETRLFADRLLAASRLYADPQRRFNARTALGVAQMLRFALRHPRPPADDERPGLPPNRRGLRHRRLRAKALLYDSLPQLLRYADRNAMAFSRETRLPFLDYDLVEFVSQLPEGALVADGWQKLILRRAGEGVVPAEVLWRADKMGYAAPLDRWLRQELKTWANERLFTGEVTKVDGYRRNEVERLWTEHQSGTADRSWALWRWISLSEWLTMLQDGTWRRGASPSVSGAQLPHEGVASRPR